MSENFPYSLFETTQKQFTDTPLLETHDFVPANSAPNQTPLGPADPYPKDTTENDFELLEEPTSKLTAQDDYSFEAFATNPKATRFYREVDGLDPIDEVAFHNWFQAQPAERQDFLNDQRRFIEAREAAIETGSRHAHNKLIAEVPELYNAKLPPWLAKRITPGTEYALGFNQSYSSDVSEATDSLNEFNGVDMDGYNYHHRFRMFDASMSDYLGQDDTPISLQIEQGNYNNPSIGRFVVVFPRTDPFIKADVSIARAACEDEAVLPQDFEAEYFSGNESKRSINTKYVAGFIDNEGNFWTNENFMADTTGANLVRYVGDPTITQPPPTSCNRLTRPTTYCSRY
jgi:hypothetical protein